MKRREAATEGRASGSGAGLIDVGTGISCEALTISTSRWIGMIGLVLLMIGEGAEMMILRGAEVEIDCFPSGTAKGAVTTAEGQHLSCEEITSATSRESRRNNDLTSRVTRSASSTAASTPSTHSLVLASRSVPTNASPIILVLHSVEPAALPS